MPQRTNEFQELVALVQRALAPTGARVTPSAMVDVPGQNGPREIDVLIESGVGPYRIAIAVEAKDERRKMDQTRLEQLLGKYQSEGSIKVNKVVIITHQGFLQPAIDRAKQFGDQVELLTYKEAESFDWLKLGPKPIPFRFAQAPHVCKVRFAPSVPEIDLKRLWNEARIVCSHGRDFGTPASYASIRFHDLLKRQPTFYDDLRKHALTDPKGNTSAGIQCPLDHHSLTIDGKSFPITEIAFLIHAVYSESSMQLRGCAITDASGHTTMVPMAEVNAGGRKIQIVFPEGLKSKQIVVKFGDLKTDGKSTADQDRTANGGDSATPAPES